MSRDARREFEADVFYDAWSRGLNPDRATQCADDCYYDGRTASECVDGYARQVERQRQERQMEEDRQAQEYEAAYYAQLEQDAMQAAYEQACAEDASAPDASISQSRSSKEGK